MELNFVNFRGDTISLTNNPYFHLINIDGQTMAASDISSLIIGGIDGDIVNNIQAQPRSIVMDFRIKSGVNVEEAKRAILGVIKLKKECSLIWTQNERTVAIYGVVEGVEMPRWSNEVTMQVTLHCSQPFWEDVQTVVQEISEAIGLHYFTDDPDGMLYFTDSGIPLGEYDFTRTRAFSNAGDVAVGMEIEIVAFDTVTNPIIYDDHGNFFGVGYGTGAKKVVMASGDIILINTGKGKKSVKLNGTSIFDKIKPSSTWLQLEAGDNQFSVNSDDESLENMTFALTYKQRYI